MIGARRRDQIGGFSFIIAVLASVVTVYLTAQSPWLRGCLPYVGAVGDCGRITEIVADSASLNWVERRPANDHEHLSDIVYGDGLFVAVGSPGLVVTSRDGVSWDQRTVTPDVRLTAVTYGNGIWVAASLDRGLVFTSPDAATWTARQVDASQGFRAAAFGNGRFALSGIGRSFYSDDAVSWLPAQGGGSLSGLDWDGERFRGAGANFTIVASVNGSGYAPQSVEPWLFRPYTGGFNSGPDHILYGVARGSGRYVAVAGDGRAGSIFVSEDGAQWRRHLWVNASMHDVIHAGGQFVAVGGRSVATSPDGLEWTRASLPIRSEQIRRGLEPIGGLEAVAWGQGRYVVVAVSGQIFSSHRLTD